MLEGLFGAEDIKSSQTVTHGKPGLPSPPRPRYQCGFAGISNQGATCYLNSLLQTLLFTPEFRESLFSLGENELGNLQWKDIPSKKVRVIPIQLQRLFTRLLLSDQQSISTTELTDSFGWNNNEELQQHDVQELNRILFSAIEASLVGTRGKDLIRRLYHGSVVNQIICSVCGKISEREEDFLDLTVTVAGHNSLEEGLCSSFIDMESLDGKNQYKCERCNKLVNAKKGARIRSLPEILTISLLRFSFDFQKLERYKETGKIVFPNTIDMAPYCEKEVDSAEYELFSVVIHKGGAYGGHYHAFIRDVDSLGKWTHPDEESIQLPTDPSTGEVDYIEVDSPVTLIQAILKRSHTLTIDKLCAETGKIVFPNTIDMAPYCEKEVDSAEYELFSVVIHKGGAYGGHYHAFIRDVDSLGKWTHPDEESIQLPTDPSTGEVDYIEVDSPVTLIQAILKRSHTLTIDKLCAEMSKQTGVSWNKRFKKLYGPIVKFLEKNSDVFEFGPATNQVSLYTGVRKTDENKTETSMTANQPRNKRPHTPTPSPGHAWFNFDDSRVFPVREKEIEKQFMGKESAYMLFYRKKSLERPVEAMGNPAFGVPDSYVTEVIMENDLLQQQRQEYELEVNRITVQIHFSHSYLYYSGALHQMPDECSWMELSIDRRKTIGELITAVMEIGGELVPDNFIIQRVRELPAGLHLYDIVSADGDKVIKDANIDDGTMLFIWDGVQVKGELVPYGIECEPVLLNLSYGDNQLFIRGFAKSLTLEEFKVIICNETGIPVKNLKLKRLVGQDSCPKLIDFTNDLLDTTLEMLKFKDGDEIIVDNKLQTRKSDEVVQDKIKLTFPIFVENHCSNVSHADNKTVRLEVTDKMTVKDIKAAVMSKFCIVDVPNGGRLRLNHDTQGLRSPLYETLTLHEAHITKGSNLVLEAGLAPGSNQLTLTFTPGDPRSDLSDMEITLDKMTTVGDCLQCMILKADFTDDEWHLQKTNWCGEAAEVLDDLDLTLEMSLVNHGDHLLLVKGKLPPKGFIRICMYLYPSPKKPFCDQGGSAGGGMFSWITNQIKGLSMTFSSKTELVTSPEEPVYIGDIEVALTTTLEDFKFQILTLQLISELSLPTPAFLRVRMIENQNLSIVLKGDNQTLQKLKLKSCSTLAVQILDEEENLNVNQIVLCVKQRLPNTREYLPGVEIIWDTSQGPTINSLQTVIEDRLFIPAQHLGMAKHFPKRYEWLIIKEDQIKNPGKKKTKKMNLRHGPYNIQDGDIIGVKNVSLENNKKDDYGTPDDDIGKLELQRQAEEKKKQREERKKYQDALDCTAPKSHRPEVALTIKVGDFN